MTRNRLIELRERQARLIERAAGERERLAAILSRADGALSRIETLRRALAAARLRPWLLAAGVALLVALRPRRALKLLASGWWLWKLYQRLRRGWALAASFGASAAAHRP